MIFVVARKVFDAIVYGISNIFRCSCDSHPFVFFIQWSFILPTYILALILCLPFTFFPIAIIFFIRILELLSSLPDNHHDLISRVVEYFHRIRYQIRYRSTSYISSNFDDWVNKIRTHNHASFLPIPFLGSPSFIPLRRILFAWFFILPALFFTLLLLSLVLLPPVLLLLCVLFICTAAFRVLATRKVAKDATHVPAFYAPETKEGQYSRMVVFALFGIVFGGIHCAGWNFKFPTLVEQHLWRSTSLTITVIPLVVALVDFILTKREENMAMFTTVVFWALDLIMTPTFRVCRCRTCARCTAACAFA